jgi:hypothetical protein
MLNSDPRRNYICHLAFIEMSRNSVGSDEKEDEPDPVAKKYRRQGWDRLLEYFHVAAPGMIPDDNIIFAGYPLPDWCGIFALWAIKTAGLPVGTWRPSLGIGSVRGFEFVDRNHGESPQPGDVGCFIHNGHMDLIYRVNGDTVETIDGNNYGRITGPKTRKIKDFDAGFYTAFNTKMFPATPVGRWEVHIGVWTWIYNFREKGSERTVEWCDLHHPNFAQGTGRWWMDNDALQIQWDQSRERWDLPLTANDQSGIWIVDGGLGDYVRARKLKPGEWK